MKNNKIKQYIYIEYQDTNLYHIIEWVGKSLLTQIELNKDNKLTKTKAVTLINKLYGFALNNFSYNNIITKKIDIIIKPKDYDVDDKMFICIDIENKEYYMEDNFSYQY